MHIDQIKEGQTYVDGRSEETARDLIQRADALGLTHEVFTTNFGYIVPSVILEDAKDDDDAEDKSDGADDSDGGVDDETSDPAAGEETAEEKAEEFDPTEATVDEVKEYLDHSDDTERERVLAAEAAGKKRKGILDLAVTSEGAK